jgi:hypothetical protein
MRDNPSRRLRRSRPGPRETALVATLRTLANGNDPYVGIAHTDACHDLPDVTRPRPMPPLAPVITTTFPRNVSEPSGYAIHLKHPDVEQHGA